MISGVQPGLTMLGSTSRSIMLTLLATTARAGTAIPANRSSSGSSASTSCHQLEVLGRPRRLVHLQRDREPEALRVDLGGVGQQGLVADRRSTPRTATRVVIRASCCGSAFHSFSRSAYGDSRPRATMASSSATIRARWKREVVVELQHLPGLAERRGSARVGRGVEGGDARSRGTDVVGVRVAAVLVVRGHHVRPELPDHLDQRRGRLLEVDQSRTALRQRRRRVALGQAGVDEARARPARCRGSRGPGPSPGGGSRRCWPATSGRSIAGLRIEPRSPPVQVATTTSTPSATYLAVVAAPLLDSSSGWACTCISRSRSPSAVHPQRPDASCGAMLPRRPATPAARLRRTRRRARASRRAESPGVERVA